MSLKLRLNILCSLRNVCKSAKDRDFIAREKYAIVWAFVISFPIFFTAEDKCGAQRWWLGVLWPCDYARKRNDTVYFAMMLTLDCVLSIFPPTIGASRFKNSQSRRHLHVISACVFVTTTARARALCSTYACAFHACALQPVKISPIFRWTDMWRVSVTLTIQTFTPIETSFSMYSLIRWMSLCPYQRN